MRLRASHVRCRPRGADSHIATDRELIACGALGATGPDGATYHAPVTKLHLWACVSALIAGAITLSRPKGTAAHRIVGFAYVGATILYCVSSLAMFPSTGQFTPFHAVAAQNLMLVGLGTGLSRYLRRRVRASWT